MFKKLLICILLCSLLLTGCGKEETKEYGEIKDVVISEEKEDAYPEKNIFIPSDNTLGYEYKEVSSRRAMMKIQVPKNWDITFSNQRHIEMKAPADDPIFPAVTMHLMHSFRPLSTYGDQGVETFEEFFSKEREKLYYSDQNQSDYYHVGIGYPSYLITDDSITTDISAITMHVYEKADLFGRVMGHSPDEEYCAVYAYIKWEDTAHSLSIACPMEKVEEAKALLNYITSSITYLPPQPGTMKVETYEGISLTIPEEFKRNEGNNYVVFSPGFSSDSCHAGSAIGIYDLDYTSLDKAAIWDFCQPGGPGEKICRTMYSSNQQYMLGVCAPAETITLDGVQVEVISPTVDVFSGPDVYNPLELISNNYLCIYAMPKSDGGMRAIVYMGTSSPLESGQVLINSILTKTKIS